MNSFYAPYQNEDVLPFEINHSEMCLWELKKITDILNNDTWSIGYDEAGMVPSTPQRLIQGYSIPNGKLNERELNFGHICLYVRLSISNAEWILMKIHISVATKNQGIYSSFCQQSTIKGRFLLRPQCISGHIFCVNSLNIY
jgi:hypothetical protein